MHSVVLNCLLFVAIFSVAGIYRWISKVPPDDDSRPSHQSIRYVLDNRTGEIVLQDNQFTTWLNKRGNQSQIYSLIQNVFCHIHTRTGSISSKSDHQNLVSSSPKHECELNLVNSLGPFPSVTNVNPNETRIPSRPSAYKPSMIYALQPSQENSQLPCTVHTAKREKEYQLLRHWIQLAEENGLIWWLGYGSLLGAVRDGDFIPYDHDTDIVVLDSAEPIIRRLETPRENMTFDKINLITRKQNYCMYDHMPRLNCQGVPVRFQLDPCGFCTPLARLISSYFDFFDMFMARIELHWDPDGNPARIGVIDEGSDKDGGLKLSYALDDIFPLATCRYMGLNLPCPRNPHAVLSHLYGENYLRPNRLCDFTHGHWSNG
ncbi:hypothetical protein D915_003694 [Fasciola hepatica]|uniref:LicD/FKTN/FKRP nucleotidyltransferase domain-containing protein n=1 Tax=Fasciola hepatica TaxID=6192 RepID=A0A4E0RA80_FASHE|nr:hypothetical protein D915_003694 [Fasciola hepatica]